MQRKHRRHAAIIGGGNMGADVALTFAAGGWQAHVVEPWEATRKKLPDYYAKGLKQIGSKASLDRFTTHAALEDVPTTTFPPRRCARRSSAATSA